LTFPLNLVMMGIRPSTKVRCDVAGKVKTGERNVSWEITFRGADKSVIAIQMRGTEFPIETLATMDKVDRDYVLRQTAGMEIVSVSFKRVI
jgi:hypothetical protein